MRPVLVAAKKWLRLHGEKDDKGVWRCKRSHAQLEFTVISGKAEEGNDATIEIHNPYCPICDFAPEVDTSRTIPTSAIEQVF